MSPGAGSTVLTDFNHVSNDFYDGKLNLYLSIYRSVHLSICLRIYRMSIGRLAAAVILI